MFQVRKGAVVGGSLTERIPHNEFLCSEKKYQDFELRLEAKLEGQGRQRWHSVSFRAHSQPPRGQGYQCDMGTAWNRPVWGSLYDESRRRKMLVDADVEQVKKVLRPDAWNEFRIRCEGPRIRIWLNGTLTVDYTEPDDKSQS